jgi:hypothetical protein
MLKIERNGALALCLIALLLVGCGAEASQQQAPSDDLSANQTGLRLVPTTDALSVDEAGDVEIHLDNAGNLYGLHLHIKFDPTKLQVQDADQTQEGIQIAPGVMPAPDFAVRNMVDNQRGTIEYAVVQLSPRQPAQGSGVVATIQFQGVSKGDSPLTLQQVKLADPDGHELPVQFLDVQFQVN